MSVDVRNPTPPNFVRHVGPDEVPSHVPGDLIRSSGITFGPEFLAAPHNFMAEMHYKFPALFYDVSPFGNAWSATKHEDALFILRHTDIFSNEGATPFPRDPNDYFYFIPIEIDPPQHRKYRNIVDPLFSPQGVMKLEAMMRQLANELIDGIFEKGECDFSTEFGRPFPVTIFLRLMGLPVAMTDTFVEWAVALLHSNDRTIMTQTMATISAYLKDAIAEKKANPDDGVISLIAHAAPDGEPLCDKEIFGFVIFLFIGGLDTVFATLNNIWLWLANNPDRRQEMMNDPENINAQVEELMRVNSVTFSGRTVVKDHELRGVQLKAGDKINCILPACNFDPDVFPNPTEVDFHRPKKIILAFTVGVHSCMGAHLARLESKIAIQEWLKRIPEFGIKPGAQIAYRPGGVVGPHHLPLVWSNASR